MAEGRNVKEHDLFHPIAKGTKCRVAVPFSNVEKGELAVDRGDVLVLLEPGERLYWYKARRQTDGETGLVPVTHLRLSSKTNRMKLGPNGYEDDDGPNIAVFSSAAARRHRESVSSYNSETSETSETEGQEVGPEERLKQTEKEPFFKSYETFRKSSGWFSTGGGCPASEAMLTLVLEKKARLQSLALAENRPALYMFEHKRIPGKIYIGHSMRIHDDLLRLFVELYSKKWHKLNGLERELLFESPCAIDWDLYIEMQSSQKVIELGWRTPLRILKEKSLRAQHGKGLNDSLTFTSATHWERFKTIHAQNCRQKLSPSSTTRPPLPLSARPPPLPPRAPFSTSPRYT
ncbi:uncharacterized protein [Oscarella lobularis]|uniref:uncharacterized protein n=1 Tax=Oscarella lobularis TaxID=121494 RepID=UPI0033134B31